MDDVKKGNKAETKKNKSIDLNKRKQNNYGKKWW